MHAVARLAYRGHIDNIQASWVKIGIDGVRQLLQAGVNDLGGTLMNENISRAAGATHGQGLEPEDFAEIVAPLDRPLAQRTTLYGSADHCTHAPADARRQDLYTLRVVGNTRRNGRPEQRSSSG